MKRIACLLMMLAVFGLTAFAQFDRAINISNTPNTPAMWPQVAFGPDGILHVVWVKNVTSLRTTVMHATYDGVSVSKPDIISNTDQRSRFFPFIAMNNSGKIAVIWGEGNEHWMAVYDPVQKAWLAPEMVADEFSGNGFLSRPKIALDEDGNIYTFYFGNYRGFTRSKINGIWEAPLRLGEGGLPVKEGGICAAPDGRIWVVFGRKESGGDYKVAYKIRTKDTPWGGGALAAKLGKSQEQPFIGVGFNSIPYLVYLGNDGQEGSNVINMAKMDGEKNPAAAVVGPSAFHYPRVAVDNLGFQHIASQYGQGDHGLGIQYFTNASGAWTGLGILPSSQGEPKLPGIASEAFGNIAVSYDSITNGIKAAYVTTRYPVVAKHFYAPTNLAVQISYTGSMSRAASVIFSLSWSKNPDNNDQYIRGYKLYKKAAGGDWQLVIEVGKDILSYSFEFSDSTSPLTQKTQFGISTVSVTGLEGDLVVFQ